MAWLGTVSDGDKILTDMRVVESQMIISQGTEYVSTLTRQDTIYTYVWRGLAGTAATDYVGSVAGGTNIEDVQAQRVDDSGQYIVQKSEIVEGTWA